MAKFPKYFHFVVRTIKKGTAIEVEDVSEADFEEVVRCKDCKYHYRQYGDGNYAVVNCTRFKRNRSLTWYCADGERKDDDRA